MWENNNPLSLKNLLAGIIITLVGGVILAWVIQDARFAPKSNFSSSDNQSKIIQMPPTPTQVIAIPDFSRSSHVEIWLGSLNKEYGLLLGPSLDDGQHKAVTVDGVSARQTVAMNADTPNAFLYFHVDDSFDFNNTNNITIYVEYFDEGSDSIFLDYDTIPHSVSGDVSNMYKSTFLAARLDSYTWKNAKITISDARFGNHQHYNADFRLSTQKTPLTVRYVRIDKSQ